MNGTDRQDQAPGSTSAVRTGAAPAPPEAEIATAAVLTTPIPDSGALRPADPDGTEVIPVEHDTEVGDPPTRAQPVAPELAGIDPEIGQVTVAIGPGEPDQHGPADLDRSTGTTAVASGSAAGPAQGAGPTRRIGRYEIVRRIGVGGFATVYAAVDPQLADQVAVKVLAENHAAEPELRRRFISEAQLARRVGNDRLIGVFDLGETDDGRPYVVMELADRGSLRNRIDFVPEVGLADVMRLVTELGACMDAIHTRGVIHRDLKPRNLLLRTTVGSARGRPPPERRLLTDDERLVLADFGLARDISDGASGLTIGGGTAGYMAPEQADQAGSPDHRADLYAATMVVAEVITGDHPRRLSLATAPIPARLRAALEQGTALDRNRRPDSAVAWRAMLLDGLTDGLSAPPASVPPTAPAPAVAGPDAPTVPPASG
ncbi:MAG: protein kinase domain-containing protein, partial [Acidimicrobiales bacterium]